MEAFEASETYDAGHMGCGALVMVLRIRLRAMPGRVIRVIALDSGASFVANRLDNCQLIPLVDLLPLVDHPEAFEAELRALDIPAGDVRHPAVFGRLAAIARAVEPFRR